METRIESDIGDATYGVDTETPTIHAPLRVIRRYCLDCAGTSNEVALCVSTGCSLWAFRFGHRPNPDEVATVASMPTHPPEVPRTQGEIAEGSRLKAIRRKCLDCSGCSVAELRGCKHTGCDLHPFRMGKSGRTMSDQQRAAAAHRMRVNESHLGTGLSLEIPDESPLRSETCGGS
jgi:hypothetical protein